MAQRRKTFGEDTCFVRPETEAEAVGLLLQMVQRVHGAGTAGALGVLKLTGTTGALGVLELHGTGTAGALGVFTEQVQRVPWEC